MTLTADLTTLRSAARLAAGHRVIEFVAAFAKAVAWPLRYWLDQRRTMQLLELDDRMLADLGVSRCDVTSALYAGSSKASDQLAQRANERRQAAVAGRSGKWAPAPEPHQDN